MEPADPDQEQDPPSEDVQKTVRDILDEQKSLMERYVFLDYRLRELFWSSGMHKEVGLDLDEEDDMNTGDNQGSEEPVREERESDIFF